MPGKFNIASMAQFVARNPFTTAAAVFTPIFAKNEDRGYFRTALITTPVIFATGAAVPKLFAGVRDFANASANERSILQKSERWTRYEQTNFNDLNTLFKDMGVGSNAKERALSDYLVSERRSRDFLKEQKTLNKYFNRQFVKTSDLVSKANLGNNAAMLRVQEIEALQATKGRLITNALHVARRSSLTPGEWESEASGILPDLNNEQMIEMFQKYENRPSFVRTLKNRLKAIKKLNYAGTIANSEVNSLPLATMNSTLDFDFDDAASVAFKKQSPGAYSYLEEARKKNFIHDIFIESEKVTTGEVGRVLSVRVTRREKGHLKELKIPIVDPATGQVRLGSNAVGVGNHVIGPDGKAYRVDEWASKMLAEQPKIPFKSEGGVIGLEEDIAAHAYWSAADPLDARRVSELLASGENTQLNTRAIKLRSYGAGVTKLPLFEVDGKAMSFYDFDFNAKRKVNFVKGLLNSENFVAMGSEAGVYEGRFQLREAMNLSPFGAPSSEKQDSIWRSVTKDFQLSAPEGLPNEARLGWRSTAWETLTGSPDLPGAKFTVASIAPQDRTVFSELPDTAEGLAASKEAIIQKFMDRKMSRSDAEAMYAQVAGVYGEGKQEAFSQLGRMGETGFLVNEEFANNFAVEGNYKYNVDELTAKVGSTLDSDDVLGFNQGERVLPKFTGTITDISKTDEGFQVVMRHQLGMQGAKPDIAGIKGMIPVTPTNEHFGQLREIMNSYYQKTGSGDYISGEVNTLAPAEYFANKVDPAHAYLEISSDLLNRMEAQGAGSVSQDYLAKLSGEGINRIDGQLVIDASKNSLKDEAAASRLRRLSQINENFFAQAGDAIRKANGYQDPVLTAFAQSNKTFGDWMLKNNLPAMGMAWDHSLVNAPRFSSISHDIETFMGLGGNYAGLKAMQSRLQSSSGGSVQQSRDFLNYLMVGNFKKEMGVTIPLREAFSGRGSLNEAANRAGSIFDPSVEVYKANFRVDLGNGKFLPVPGTEAYGAEAAQYEPGKYQTRPWQHALHDLSNAKTPEEAIALEAKLMGEYQSEFGIGKGSALRPYQYDPMGAPGFLSSSAERGDPFLAKVSPEWVEKMVHSKRLRDDLNEGGYVVGMMNRQPTNQTFYMKYKLDKSMAGTLDVAVPESVSRAYMGDQDKDLTNHILFDANVRMENNKLKVASASSKIERDAAEEAILAMEGKQAQQLAIWESVKGDKEIAARASLDWEMTSLAAKNEKFATSVARRTGVAVNRTAGASIGSYSNVLTEMVEQMVRNPAMMADPERVARLKAGLFDIRQAPISARKAHTSFSLETAMQKIDLLHKGLASENPETAASKIHSTLLNMTETLMEGGKSSSEYKYWAGQGAEDIKAWAYGRSYKASLMADILTVSGKGEYGAERGKQVLSEAFDMGIGSVMGPVHGGRISEETSSTLGRAAEYIGSKGRDAAGGVTGKLGKIFTEHGTGLALGLGSLAALGVALTPRKAPRATFSRSSGNKYRPEERHGVADHIPGEPVAGQLAPSNPPRRMEMAQPGVRRAVVAPIGQTSDVSVRMRATDQSRAAETTRLLSQIGTGGDSNVTVNYRDRTKLRSLRTREKIRELR